jgi:hypothetical protein
MMIRAFVVPVLVILTLASSAWAECAWVLWVDDSQDSPLGAFPTKDECEQRKQRVASQREKLGLVERLNCYPDSMDPRPRGWHAALMTVRDFIEGPQMMTVAILIGGVVTSFWAHRSGRRYWLWVLVGILGTSVAFGVVSGLIRGLSR